MVKLSEFSSLAYSDVQKLEKPVPSNQKIDHLIRAKLTSEFWSKLTTPESRKMLLNQPFLSLKIRSS